MLNICMHRVCLYTPIICGTEDFGTSESNRIFNTKSFALSISDFQVSEPEDISNAVDGYEMSISQLAIVWEMIA